MSDHTPPVPLTADVPESTRRLLQRSDEIAARISALMHEQKLNQSALSDKTGKSRSYVSRVLSGTVNLTLKTVAEFEAALGADVFTVPAWEPPYPRRRRSGAVSETPAPLEDGLPRSLCDRLAAVADRERTTVSALLTLWATERLALDTATRPVASLTVGYDSLDLGRIDFALVNQVTVSVPTGYPSSPIGSAQALAPRPCVTPHGELVLADAFSAYDPEDSGR